jgi:hypothetical protein
MSNRINQTDILEKDKLEVSSFLIYKKEYRELSNDAKFMYQYLIKRFSLTQHKLAVAIEENTMDDFTFVDDNGELFCYVSNDELRFVLSISEPTVKKCKKELTKVGLLEEVKQTAPKTNRLYVNKVSIDVDSKAGFHNDLREFKTAEFTKRKEKNAKRKAPKVKEKPAPKKPVESIEPKKVGFNEPKDIEFMNQRIFGHSTYESFSTTEPKSTKELYQSIYDVLNENNDIPMNVKQVVNKNKDRLIDDLISVWDVILLFKSTDNTVNDHDFALILNNVLTKTKTPIKSIHAVMKSAMKNHYDEYTGELMPNAGDTYEMTDSLSTFKSILEGDDDLPY